MARRLLRDTDPLAADIIDGKHDDALAADDLCATLPIRDVAWPPLTRPRKDAP